MDQVICTAILTFGLIWSIDRICKTVEEIAK
jgi:hypothetical protein